MDVDKMNQRLFRSDTRLFGVLDGASIPDLPRKMHEARVRNECLLTGDLPPAMVHAAPYLVFLPPGDRFSEWVVNEGFGKHWGIFAHSRHSMNELRRHFQGLVSVNDERGRSLTFRFYDPRVLTKFLPTCTPEELATVFGKVDTFWAETGEGQGLAGFQIENEKLRTLEAGN